MKKKFVLLCALLIGLTISGCDKKENQPKQPEVNMVVVPSLIGQTYASAQPTLGILQLKICAEPNFVNVNDNQKDGKIVEQNPIAGVIVAEGSEIQVTIGKYTETGD